MDGAFFQISADDKFLRKSTFLCTDGVGTYISLGLSVVNPAEENPFVAVVWRML